MRFYDVDFGEILLDGVNIQDYNLHDLRKAISLVMQEPIIFNYSILENVLYGKLDAQNKEVYDASVISNAIEFIENENKLFSYDESAAALTKEMNKNKDEIIKLIGEKKFNEEIETLKKLEESESKKGNF
jgi:ABC-type transport system involved in cytochrome bd biosynthesis fused ATPase/permease subunit